MINLFWRVLKEIGMSQLEEAQPAWSLADATLAVANTDKALIREALIVSLAIAKELHWWHKSPCSEVTLPCRVKHLSHG